MAFGIEYAYDITDAPLEEYQKNKEIVAIMQGINILHVKQ
ncbi:MAG: hypothetical protein JWR54_3995 [Mucilaginibacter sp.]|nr:hypothetical protein [Mucilaginibacter sp.]